MIFRSLVPLLLAFAPLIAGQSTCGDLLTKLHKKPKQLEFVEYKCRPDLQGKPQQAVYRVKGSNASEVERYLWAAFGMKPLTPACCLWESGQMTFQAQDGRVYYLSMSSEETAIYQKAEWRKIPYFSVVFALEGEEP